MFPSMVWEFGTEPGKPIGQQGPAWAWLGSKEDPLAVVWWNANHNKPGVIDSATFTIPKLGIANDASTMIEAMNLSELIVKCHSMEEPHTARLVRKKNEAVQYAERVVDENNRLAAKNRRLQLRIAELQDEVDDLKDQLS